MNSALIEEKRLGMILAKDKMKNPARFSAILRKETELFLKGFFDLDANTLSINVNIREDGEFDFVIKGKAHRIVNCTNL